MTNYGGFIGSVGFLAVLAAAFYLDRVLSRGGVSDGKRGWVAVFALYLAFVFAAWLGTPASDGILGAMLAVPCAIVLFLLFVFVGTWTMLSIYTFCARLRTGEGYWWHRAWPWDDPPPRLSKRRFVRR